MGFRSRLAFEHLFLEADDLPFEQGINQYVMNKGRLPDFYFKKLANDEVISMEDKIAHRLAERLQVRVQMGRMNFNDLEPEVIRSLDESPFIYRIIGQATAALEGEIGQARSVDPSNMRRLTFDDLTSEEGLGVYRILEMLVREELPNAIEVKRGVERILEEL